MCIYGGISHYWAVRAQCQDCSCMTILVHTGRKTTWNEQQGHAGHSSKKWQVESDWCWNFPYFTMVSQFKAVVTQVKFALSSKWIWDVESYLPDWHSIKSRFARSVDNQPLPSMLKPQNRAAVRNVATSLYWMQNGNLENKTLQNVFLFDVGRNHNHNTKEKE